ncbi:hypothetical protein TrVGV298_006401 [Trichoderma virens]|nr:hypothetical protein TrVGV298_006401 [Trichoderma virens]
MASPEPPNAKANATVVVPMAVQAFLVADDFGDTLYQIAPITQPDLFKLQQLQQPDRYTSQIGGEGGGEWDHHDLLGKVDTSWWRLQAEYNPRFRDLTTGGPRENRSGVYLSWCLPKLYRSAITATESAVSTPEDRKAFEERKLQSGYRIKDANGEAIPDEKIQFRAVPDRWIVLKAPRTGPQAGTEMWKIIESNCMRVFDHDELIANNGQDIEVITSPGINPADLGPASLDEKEPPKPMTMGRAAYLTHTELESLPDRIHRSPFNAFEMGHEFFVDYQPHNMGVFSFFDAMDDCAGKSGSVTVDYAVIGYHSDARDDPLMLDQPQQTDTAPLRNRDIMDALDLMLDNDRPSEDTAKDEARTFLKSYASRDGRTITYGLLRNVRFDRSSVNHLNAPSIKLQEDIYSHQPIAVGLHTLDALAAYMHVALGGSSTAIQTLLNQVIMLVAREDDVDSQRKAADEVASHSWVGQKEGTVWNLPQNDNGDEKMPTFNDERRNDLSKLNCLQARWDACIREEEQLTQKLYGCWWNAMGMRKLPVEVLTSRRERVRQEAFTIGNRLDILSKKKQALQETIEYAKIKLENLLGGGRSMKLVAVPTRPFGRHQDPTILLAGAKSGWPSDFSKPLPVRLASEIAPKAPANSNEDWMNQYMPEISAPVNPLLRDFFEPEEDKRSNATERKSPYAGIENMQDTQGWFPLFLEWEIEYYHIPFSKWTFEPSDEDSGRWRWVIPPENILAQDPAIAKDCRRIHGRTPFLPESALTLGSRLEQLFEQTTDKDVLGWKDEILDKVSSIEYFSSPLSGLTDNLLTLRLGHHHRPTAASCSGDSVITNILGLKPDILKKIEGLAPELAPYGASATAVSPPEYWDNDATPFKPVMHGQARFTRLVVVDKFGQIVSGIRPTEYGDNSKGESSALYPCLSPGLTCGVLDPKETGDIYLPNTAIEADKDHNVCQFFQLPPRINEHARLNVYDGDGCFVREVVIINDAKNPSVVFSMGPDGKTHSKSPTGRLAELLNSMEQFDFSYSLFDMLGGAADSNWRSSSANLDDMLPAAFGRPVCIADIASSTTKPTSILDYTFPIAMGNHTAAFDGLVGTFPSSGPITVQNISTAYSRYASKNASKPGDGYTSAEARPQPLEVKPYFIPGDTGIEDEDFAKAHNASLTQNSISAIIDVKLPIHLYSGSLFPMVELSLPRWPVDNAMSNMQAFFAAGPILIPEKPRMDLFHTATEPWEATVKMPSAAVADDSWRWMQPRLENIDAYAMDDDEPTMARTVWEPMQIKSLDTSLKVETAARSEIVEGYVMVQPRGQKK